MTDHILALVQESAWLMLVGMTVVFAFLSLLIAAMSLLRKLVERFPDTTPVPQQPAVKTNEPSSTVVAAISAAVHQFRKDNQHD